LDVCRAYQIPHSEFLSWDKDDRDKAIWQYVRERQTCKRCGTREAEWLESEGGHRHAYTPVLKRCPGCEAMETYRANIDESKQGKGVYIALVPTRR
jgi:hypothetical protein